MIRFVLALVFVVSAGAAHAADLSPSSLQETLNSRLEILLASDPTIKAARPITVAKVGADWVIVYPGMEITQAPGKIYKISSSKVTLKSPQDIATGEAIVELPATISAVGESETKIAGQQLSGTWSYTDHVLTAIQGNIAKVVIQKANPANLIALNDVAVDIRATLNNPDTADLAFSVTTGAGAYLPPSFASGFMPRSFSATGTVTRLPKEYLILGALMPLAQSKAMLKAGTEVHLDKMNLVTASGASATGDANLRASVTSPRKLSGTVNTRWTNMAAVAQQMQASLLAGVLPPEEKRARTQQMLAFMLAQSFGVQEGNETVFNVDLGPDGSTIVNGKDVAQVGSTMLGSAMSQIPPQFQPKGQIPVDSAPRNP